MFVCVRVLQLMNLTDSRLAQAGNERLELAMLSFFEQFRKIYIGDQVQKSSKVSSVARRLPPPFSNSVVVLLCPGTFVVFKTKTVT